MTDSQPRPKRILVVDDELVNRKVIEGFLKAFGHDCVLAESGVQALDILDPSFDLVLLDIMMPDMDGFSVLREMRQKYMPAAETNGVPALVKKPAGVAAKTPAAPVSASRQKKAPVKPARAKRV